MIGKIRDAHERCRMKILKILPIMLIVLLFIPSTLAQGTTRISFSYTKSFPYSGQKTGLMHNVSWDLTLRFDFYFPIDITTETNATEVEPNDYVKVNATAKAPENKAYCKLTVNGELNISGPQVNRKLWIIEMTTDKNFTTPIGEKTVDIPPIEISDNPEVYAVILDPLITFYTAVLAKTSTEGCSVESGASPEWHSDGETTTTIIRISSEAKEGDMAKLNLIDISYNLGASIWVTVKLRILTEEVELDTWLFTIPGETVPASDTVTIPLSWNVIPEFSLILLIAMLILATSIVLIMKENKSSALL